MTQRGKDWCILRTGPARTLALAASLRAAGIDAWTPAQKAKRLVRNGKPNARGQKPSVEVDAPILPSFVFARASRLPDLVAVAVSPISSHPAFSIFRYAGRIPLIDDREIASLRRMEEVERERIALAERKAKRPRFARGQDVRCDEPAFTGLIGQVLEMLDGKAVVSFGGTFNVTIASWLLRPDEVVDVPVMAA